MRSRICWRSHWETVTNQCSNPHVWHAPLDEPHARCKKVLQCGAVCWCARVMTEYTGVVRPTLAPFHRRPPSTSMLERCLLGQRSFFEDNGAEKHRHDGRFGRFLSSGAASALTGQARVYTTTITQSVRATSGRPWQGLTHHRWRAGSQSQCQSKRQSTRRLCARPACTCSSRRAQSHGVSFNQLQDVAPISAGGGLWVTSVLVLSAMVSMAWRRCCAVQRGHGTGI